MIDFLNPSAELLAGLEAGRDESRSEIIECEDQIQELEKENERLKKFLKLIYENRFEIDKLYLFAERAKEYFIEDK